MSDVGNVQRMVKQLQSPGTSASDRGRSMGGLAARHGTAEQRSDQRHGPFRDRSVRSRERSTSRQSSPRQTTLRQTMADLDARFTAIEDRMDTVERYTRMHAQTIAKSDEAITSNYRRNVAIEDYITKYKAFITSSHHAIDGFISSKTNVLQASIDSIAQVVSSRIEAMEIALVS